MSPMPGQRSAQTPQRAAVSSSRSIGRAAAAGGGMSAQIDVYLRGEAPFRLSVGDDGREVRTCLRSGAQKQEGAPGPRESKRRLNDA